MTTKVKSNRTKRIETTEGTALVILNADESRMIVTGRIRWLGEDLVAFEGDDGQRGNGVSRSALRDLAKAILEAAEASEWHEETAAVEPPSAKDDGLHSLADLGFTPRGIGDRNKDQAAPAPHEAIIQPGTKWSVCSCGWIPRFAVNRADSERRVANHVLNPTIDDPAGRPVADRPQA